MQRVISAGLASLAVGGTIALTVDVAHAQVRPDGTLGAENSRVRNQRILGRDGIERDSDLIEGGARRGGNLFHSFEQFDVPEGRGAYFDNPLDVQNIFSRVTGADRSEILGKLGVLGNANLFFTNPNGILFGPNASLDVGGSFAATTANAIQFSELGFFSATNPEVPSQILTINPSAFWFNQVLASSIENRSITGLNVSAGQSLLLLGGNIVLDRGQLIASSGRIELGGILGSGIVGLNGDSSDFRLTVPDGLVQADISLRNQAIINASGERGGNIRVLGNRVTLDDESSIFSDTLGDQNGLGVFVRASQLNIRNSSISSSTTSSGKAGDIDIQANASIDVLGQSSLIGSVVTQFATGDSANIDIETGRLTAREGAQIRTSTGGIGNSGNLLVNASEAVNLVGTSANRQFSSALFTRSEQGSQGDGGNLTIETGRLIVQDGAQVSTRSRGMGSAGDLTINASESVELLGAVSGTSTRSRLIAVGFSTSDGAGDLTINTRRFTIRGGAIAVASTFGQGNAGNIIVNASDVVELRGTDGQFNRSALLAETSGSGDARNLTINTRQLIIGDGAIASTSTFDDGQSGNLTVNASDLVELVGTSADSRFRSALAAEAYDSGDSRNLTINTNRLIIRDGAVASATTSGGGRAGNLTVNASNTIELAGSSVDNQFLSALGSETSSSGNAGDLTINTGQLIIRDRALVSSQIAGGGTGNAGDIRIWSKSLLLSNGGEIAASVFREENGVPGGRGRAGNIRINVSDFINIDGIGSTGFSSGIFANTQQGASGRGGELEITAGRLRVANGAVITAQTLNDSNSGNITINADSLAAIGGGQIVANTLGGGNAGDITLNVRDITLSSFDSNYNNRLAQFPDAPVANTSANSGVFATVETGSIGDGGDITIQTSSLSLTERAQISAATNSTGRAGTIAIRGTTANTPTETISLNNSSISTEIGQNGAVGASNARSNIDIQVRALNLNNNSDITASIFNQGNAGNITIRDANNIDLNNSNIASTVNARATGEGGSITLNTDSLNLNRANITASTQGQGRAGDVTVQGANQVSLNRSNISTAVGETGVGQGGAIDIQTGRLDLQNRSNIISSTANHGDTGSIAITATDGINLRNNSTISNRVETGATGNSQRISLDTPNLSLRGNSAISAATDGNGRAGDIRIRNGNQSTDTISLSNSTISTQVQRNAIVPVEDTRRAQPRSSSNQGNITIDARRLELDNAAITASTNGQGRAGNVIVNNAEQISLNDSSRISSAVGRNGQGRGGNVVLDTDSLSLDNSRINTNTNGDGRAGNITVDADNLEAANGGRLVSSTNRRQRAGTITLRDLDRINLSGSNREGPSGIFANTRRSGRGGVIDLQTQQLTLSDGATISTTSQGSGQAGNIRINAVEQLQSEGGNIITNANRSAGGNISLTGGDINLRQGSNIRTDVERGDGNGGDITVDAAAVRLQDDSDIQTRVGEDGKGDGGDITVNADSVIAFDDSDIITEAPNQGGDIQLETPVFFGAGYQQDAATTGSSDGNGRVDLDASGQVSSGTVQTPDTSFIQNSLSDLPTSAIDTEALLANSCIARTEDGGTFLITGAGGLPPNRPGTAPLSAYPTDRVRVEAEAGWQPGDPIIEPEGVYRLPNGELVISHECP